MSAIPSKANVVDFAKPQAAFVCVTPDIARRWLTRNHINRTARVSKVNQYARDMAEGRWTASNDAICFDPEGMLLNGQHRLLAVIQANTQITFAVMRNIPREAMTNMDAGASRKVSDTLHMDGEKWPTVLGSTLKQIILIDSGRFYRDNKVQAVSRGEILHTLAEMPEVRDSVAIASAIQAGIDLTPTTLAIGHLLIARVNGRSLADHFLRQAASKVNEPEGSAVHALSTHLREASRHGRKIAFRNQLFLLLKTWNYYAADKRVTKLQSTPKAGTDFRLPEVARWTRPS